MPARLMLRQLRAGLRRAEQTEIAHGSLQEMVQLATEWGTDDALPVCIDCRGAPKPLVWADIVALRREPTFPIDI
jgi:hypothetical protein